MPHTSLVAFTTGAALAVHRKPLFVATRTPLLIAIITATIALIIASTCNTAFLRPLYTIGPVCLTMAAAKLIPAHTIPGRSTAARSTMFIFVAHYYPLHILAHLVETQLHPSGPALYALYLACPAIVIAVCLAAYCIMTHTAPRLTKAICR